MFRKIKKGFTLVELVIVIAVIAVLAGILIPTFVSVSNKAQAAADKSFIKSANTQLAVTEAEKGNIETMYDAVKSVREIGYDVPHYKPSQDADVVWDSVTRRFALINKAGTAILESESEIDLDHPVNLWKAYTTDAVPAKDNQTYSIYVVDGNSSLTSPVEVKVGFDVGEVAGITKIKYTNSAVEEVTFRTYSVDTDLEIDNTNAEVKHFGIAGEVKLTHVKGLSFHAYGKIGFADLLSGRFVAEPGSETKAVYAAPSTVVYNNGGIIEHAYCALPETRDAHAGLGGNVTLEVEEKTDSLIDGAVEELNNEVNPVVHDLTPEDKEAQANGAVCVIDGEYQTSFKNFYVGGNHTIKLLATIVSSDDGALGLFFGAKVDLNLNGYSFLLRDGMHLTYDTDSPASMQPELTIRDSSGESGIFALDFESLGFGLLAIDSKLNIYGGTFRATGTDDDLIGCLGSHGSVNIYGGRFVADENHSCIANIPNITINGGTFDATASGSSVFGFSESSRSIDYSKATIVEGSTVYKA